MQDWRPYPNYTGVLVENHISYSNYNALQVSLNKQSGALTYNLNYTWSKALGIRGTNGNGSVGDSLNMRNNYGLLPYNRKQAINITFSYQEGTKYHGNRIVGGFLNQWEISGITSIQSGPDVAAFNSNFGLGGGYAYLASWNQHRHRRPFDGITQLGTPSVAVQPLLTCDPKYNLPGISTARRPSSMGIASLCRLRVQMVPSACRTSTARCTSIRTLPLSRTSISRDRGACSSGWPAFNFLNHPNWQLYGGPAAGLSLGLRTTSARLSGTGGSTGNTCSHLSNIRCGRARKSISDQHQLWLDAVQVQFAYC